MRSATTTATTRLSPRSIVRNMFNRPVRNVAPTLAAAGRQAVSAPDSTAERNTAATRLMSPVSVVLADASDLRRVPWLLPEKKFYACEVIVLDDNRHEIDLDTWAFLNEHGVIVRFVPSFADDANVALDTILTSASGDLIVALDNYRCDDIADVADLLAGADNGADFMKDVLVLGDSHSRSQGHGRRESSMAWRYSSANGTPIRDFGVGSFVLRRDAVTRVLGVSRPPTGEGSPLGREALASLAIGASLAKLVIHEAPVYACERETEPLVMEFLDHIGPRPKRLANTGISWHNATATSSATMHEVEHAHEVEHSQDVEHAQDVEQLAGPQQTTLVSAGVSVGTRLNRRVNRS